MHLLRARDVTHGLRGPLGHLDKKLQATNSVIGPWEPIDETVHGLYVCEEKPIRFVQVFGSDLVEELIR